MLVDEKNLSDSISSLEDSFPDARTILEIFCWIKKMAPDAIFHKPHTHIFLGCFSISYSARRTETITMLIPFSWSAATGIVDSANGAESRVNNVCETQLTGTLVFTVCWCKGEHLGEHGHCRPFAGDERTEGKPSFQLKNISLALVRRNKWGWL